MAQCPSSWSLFCVIDALMGENGQVHSSGIQQQFGFHHGPLNWATFSLDAEVLKFGMGLTFGLQVESMRF